MGKWKAVVPILVAVVIALVGSSMTYKWAKQQTVPTQTVEAEAETAQVAVAAVDLGWGTQLTGDKVKLLTYLKASLPPGHFSAASDLEGRVIILPVKQDEPILESRLAPTSMATGGVSAIVKGGHRALAVKGDNVLGLSGLIRPGNRVDVLVSYSTRADDKEITKVVLENVLVLATGSEVRGKGGDETQPVDVYTLEVTPEDAEKLALAATQGKLHFALRNAMDTETVLTKGATIAETLSSFRLGQVVVHKGVPKPVVRTGVSVEVIRGADVSKQTFSK
ncbi:MAG: Flp pilus assembly protein CpaB [bacterium]